jgi:hypothetical protein
MEVKEPPPPPVPIGYEAGWPLASVWMLWRREKYFTAWNRTLVVQAVAIQTAVSTPVKINNKLKGTIIIHLNVTLCPPCLPWALHRVHCGTLRGYLLHLQGCKETPSSWPRPANPSTPAKISACSTRKSESCVTESAVIMQNLLCRKL